MDPYEQGYQDILVKVGLSMQAAPRPSWVDEVKKRKQPPPRNLGQDKKKPVGPRRRPKSSDRNRIRGISGNASRHTGEKPLELD